DQGYARELAGPIGLRFCFVEELEEVDPGRFLTLANAASELGGLSEAQISMLQIALVLRRSPQQGDVEPTVVATGYHVEWQATIQHVCPSFGLPGSRPGLHTGSE